VSVKKDFKKVIEAAERQGWRTKMRKNGHWVLYAPNGEDIVHASGTPGNPGALDDFVGDLRRTGEFVWKGH
jgi:hypothetical protein